MIMFSNNIKSGHVSSHSRSVQTDSGSHSACYAINTVAPSSAVKQTERETDHPASSSEEG
jgi:hypothetical protein